jgi:hypothetical protein
MTDDDDDDDVCVRERERESARKEKCNILHFHYCLFISACTYTVLPRAGEEDPSIT